MIGINVGTYVQSKVVMQEGKVIQRLKADTVANTAVAARCVRRQARGVPRRAAPDEPGAGARAADALNGRQLFAGKSDGTYGAGLRRPSRAYEKAEGLPVTGLATMTILKRLGGSGVVEPTKGRAQDDAADQDLSSGRSISRWRAFQERVETLLLSCCQLARLLVARRRHARAAGGCGEEVEGDADKQQQRCGPQHERVQLERRAQEHELAVAGLDEGEHGASLSPAAGARARGARRSRASWRVEIVDRLVLADQAAQLLR